LRLGPDAGPPGRWSRSPEYASVCGPPIVGAVKRLRGFVLAAVFVLSGCAGGVDGGAMAVSDVSGPRDARALRFIAESIENAAERGQELAEGQINSPAVLHGE